MERYCILTKKFIFYFILLNLNIRYNQPLQLISVYFVHQTSKFKPAVYRPALTFFGRSIPVKQPTTRVTVYLLHVLQCLYFTCQHKNTSHHHCTTRRRPLELYLFALRLTAYNQNHLKEEAESQTSVANRFIFKLPSPLHKSDSCFCFFKDFLFLFYAGTFSLQNLSHLIKNPHRLRN